MKPIFIFLFSAMILLNSCKSKHEKIHYKAADSARIDTFEFSNNGKNLKGKIYLPSSYNTNNDLPTIFLIDFTEQHFKLATDEFEKVIYGLKELKDIEALVVSLDGIPDIDAEPASYKEDYEIYTNMASHIDKNYSNNSSRTLIGKGSESGIVLMTLFLEDRKTNIFDNFIATDPSGLYASAIIDMIESNDFPKNKMNNKLHFSFSTSNDRATCNELIEHISKAQYPWLQFKWKEYTDSNYENTYPMAFAEGLKYVFDK